MSRYVLLRIRTLALTFVGVTILIYALVYALPGDPIRGMAGDRPIPDSVIAELRRQHHLDEPFFVQYWYYIKGIFQGDFGTDFRGRPIRDLMQGRWGTTFFLAVTAWFFEIVFGVFSGLLAALRRGRLEDAMVAMLTIVAISIPIFVLAYGAQLAIGVHLGWAPVSGIAEGWPRSYILPALVLSVFGAANVARLTRQNATETLRMDYIRTAYGKGLSKTRIVGRHVLRNSLIPTVTYLGADLGYLIGGTLIVEGIFNLPGIGQLLFTSVQQHEGPVVVTVATVLILVFLVINLIVDLLYRILDPRIKYEG